MQSAEDLGSGGFGVVSDAVLDGEGGFVAKVRKDKHDVALALVVVLGMGQWRLEGGHASCGVCRR